MKERWSLLNISKSKPTGHTGAQFLSKKLDDNNVEHDQECGDTILVSKDSYFNLKRHIMRKHDSVLRELEEARAKREHFEYG